MLVRTLRGPWVFLDQLTRNQAWDLLEPQRLTTIYDVEDQDHDDLMHVANLVALLGPPPEKFLKRSAKTKKYWNSEGQCLFGFTHLSLALHYIMRLCLLSYPPPCSQCISHATSHLPFSLVRCVPHRRCCINYFITVTHVGFFYLSAFASLLIPNQSHCTMLTLHKFTHAKLSGSVLSPSHRNTFSRSLRLS